MTAQRVLGRGPARRGDDDATVHAEALPTPAPPAPGKRIGTIKARPGRKRFTITVRPRKEDRRVHRVIARVTYIPSSRTRATTHRMTYRRAISSRTPRFTG